MWTHHEAALGLDWTGGELVTVRRGLGDAVRGAGDMCEIDVCG